MQGSGLICKSRLMQRRVQKISAAVSGKNATRAIPAMRRWRQPQNKELCPWVAKSRHSFAPVLPIAKRAPLHSRHFLAILHQPCAFAARNDFFLKYAQFCIFRKHEFIDARAASFFSSLYTASRRRT